MDLKRLKGALYGTMMFGLISLAFFIGIALLLTLQWGLFSLCIRLLGEELGFIMWFAITAIAVCACAGFMSHWKNSPKINPGREQKAK